MFMKIKVTLDGNKLIEWINRQGTKEHTYERTIDGDKMIEVWSLYIVLRT